MTSCWFPKVVRHLPSQVTGKENRKLGTACVLSMKKGGEVRLYQSKARSEYIILTRLDVNCGARRILVRFSRVFVFCNGAVDDVVMALASGCRDGGVWCGCCTGCYRTAPTRGSF